MICVKINLLFADGPRRKLLYGKKITTFRPSCKGRPGDHFFVDGHKFVIVDIMPTTLDRVMTFFYRLEGCSTTDEFVQEWGECYPGKQIDPDLAGFLHFVKLARW
jgi:hypothetical protein